jgi:hypothetical protein
MIPTKLPYFVRTLCGGVFLLALGGIAVPARALPACSVNSHSGGNAPAKENARLNAYDDDAANAAFTDCVCNNVAKKILCDGPSMSFRVDDAGVRTELRQFTPGDHLRLDFAPPRDGTAVGVLTGVRGIESYPGGMNSASEIAPLYRFLALGISALAVFALAFAVTKGAPNRFVVGQDNRYSNSKIQLAVWFWIVISTYLALFTFRIYYAGWDFLGGIGIPQNLLLLSGLSALTYGGAKAITTAKANAAADAALQAQQTMTAVTAEMCQVAMNSQDSVQFAAAKLKQDSAASMVKITAEAMKKPSPNGPRLFRDLVSNDDGVFDFGDFQMLVVTLIAVGTYLMLIFHFLHSVEFRKYVYLPDVDSTVLALFGIGQGAYLTKKAGGNVGKS